MRVRSALALLVFIAHSCCWAITRVSSTKVVASSPAIDAQPCFSGDGSKLAFVSGRDGKNEIWMIDLTTGDLKKLVHCESVGEFATKPSLARDAELLSFVSNRSGNIDVWMLELTTGKLYQLTDSPGIDWMPAISPDGKRVAFVSDRDGVDAIWMLELGDEKRLFKLRNNAWDPAWSPDGKRLAFVSGDGDERGIWVMDISERTEKLILQGGSSPSWSPDGEWLCAVRRKGKAYELVIVSADGSVCRTLPIPFEEPSSPCWSPKGDLIACDALVGGNREVILIQLERLLPYAKITSPKEGERVEGVVSVRATLKVHHGNVKRISLEYGLGLKPSDWTPLDVKVPERFSELSDEPIASLDTTQISGALTLRLRVYDEEDDVGEDRVTVFSERVYGVQYVEHTVPEEMVTSDSVQVILKLRNIGKLTWQPSGRFAVTLSYRWRDAEGNVVLRGGHFNIPKVVNESEEVQVVATVVAPAEAGSYTLEWDLCHGGAIWFSEEGCQTLMIPVRVVRRYAAQVIWHNTPRDMVPSQTYTIRVKLRNTGAMPWNTKDAKEKVFLSYHWLDQQGAKLDEQPIMNLIEEQVKAGDTVEVVARVRSPSVVGEYKLVWDMLIQGQGNTQSWFSDMGSKFEAHQVSVKAPYSVSYLWHNTPTTMLPGQIYLVNLRLKNEGALVWESKGIRRVCVVYRWVDESGKSISVPTIETPMPYDVMPGETVEVAARIQAPPVAGNYTLHWDLLKGGNALFSNMGSPTLKVDVMVQRQTCVAEFQVLSHPTTMVAGYEYEVEITILNRGTMTWLANGERPVTLSYCWLDENGNELKDVVQLRTPLPRDVRFGESVKVKARVCAPRLTGKWTLRWDLYMEGMGWFGKVGSPTLNVPVNVTAEYDYEVISHDIPSEFISGQVYTLRIRLCNRSAFTWRATGDEITQLGCKWLDEKGFVVESSIIASVPKDIQPNETVEFEVTLHSPKKAGTYTLKLDMVYMRKIWFEEKGAQPLSLQVRVK